MKILWATFKKKGSSEALFAITFEDFVSNMGSISEQAIAIDKGWA